MKQYSSGTCWSFVVLLTELPQLFTYLVYLYGKYSKCIQRQENKANMFLRNTVLTEEVFC